MLLWPEQNRLLQENFNLEVHDGRIVDADGSDASDALADEDKGGGADKKRKFCDVDDGCTQSSEILNDSDDSNSQKNSKRIKLSDYFSAMISSVKSSVSSTFSWVYNKLSFISGPPREGKSKNVSTKLKVSELKFLIFSDLNSRKYFVGPGDVYGGDYNIYKGGDPSNSHSIGTIRLVGKRNVLSARDLLSFTRVNNQVAKSSVIAYVTRGSKGPCATYLVFNFLGVSER